MRVVSNMVNSKSLIRKEVMSSDGTIIGTLANVTMDLKTGTLSNLIIKPENKNLRIKMQNGFYIIPFEDVKAVKDFIVVNRSKLYIGSL